MLGAETVDLHRQTHQCVARHRQEADARRGEFDPAGQAMEQGDAEKLLQLAHPVADGGLAERQFLRSGREAFMPRRCLEGAQG